MNQKPPFPVILLLIFLIGCTPATSTAVDYLAGQATANPILITTAQADQYQRDANATLTARDATQQVIAIEIEATAESSQATIQFIQTRDALTFAMTADVATLQAEKISSEATAEAEEKATDTAQANLVATTTAEAQATQSSILATRQTLELNQEQAKAQRESMITFIVTGLLLVTAVAVSTLIILFLWKIIPILLNRLSLIRYGQHKNPLFIMNRGNSTVITDPIKMLQSTISIDEQGNVNMPNLTPNELQMIIAGGAMQTLIEQARNAPGHPPAFPTQVTRNRKLGSYETSDTKSYLIPSTLPRTMTNQPEPAHTQVNTLPNFVNWQNLHTQQNKGLVLGLGHQGVIDINLAQTPHVLLSGSSGAGKTRKALRPLVAQALAQGVIVILLNESGADFSPFYDHPNAHIINGSPQDYIDSLTAVIQEAKRREQILRKARISEWDRLPETQKDGPTTLIVIDEVLTLALLMTPAEQKQFWNLLATYTSRARKVSMGSLGALTDPTYRILGAGLNWREQCTARISYKVAKSNISRAVLDANGAEELGENQFLAMLGSGELVKGVSANPSDEEIITYLSQNPTQPIKKQSWLLPAELPEPVLTRAEPAKTTVSTEPEPVPAMQTPINHSRPPTAQEKAYMRFLYHEDGLSKNAVCKLLYGFKNGRTYKWVSEALE